MGVEQIIVKDNVLDQETLKELKMEVTKQGYVFGWRSNLNNMAIRHWHCHFGGNKGFDAEVRDPIFAEDVPPVIWRIWNSGINYDNFNLLRAYTNAYTYGIEGAIHQDGPVEGDMTFLFYINPTWDIQWGGETIFMENGEIIKSVLPKPGRLVVFPGTMRHAARMVSKLCTIAREVLVLKAGK